MTIGGRAFAVAAMCLVLATPGAAKAPTGIKGLLSQASDSALTRLEKPGTFYKDKAIRIVLPGPLKKLSSAMKFANEAGVSVNVDKAMNDAAGIAAGAAKPVFRSAIDKMTLADGVGIVTGGDTAATDYLKGSSGEVLRDQLRPLVQDALRKTGAFGQIEKLAAKPVARLLGLTTDSLTDSVTAQTANGIFLYMGNEERALRKNPLGVGGALLDTLKKQ